MLLFVTQHVTKIGGEKMIAVNELKGKMVANGYTQEEVAKALGISPKTLYNKLKRGILGSDEIEKLIHLLSIEDPMKIFFT
jgi:transcriptional regulator with XRE-family HTH domain